MDEPTMSDAPVFDGQIPGTSAPRLPLQEYLESADDGFVALDRDFQFLNLNCAAEGILGAPRNELLGRVCWDAFPETLGTPIEAHCRRALRDGVVERFEYRFPLREYACQVRVLPGPAGLAIWLHKIPADQTASEQALRELAGVTRSLIDSSQDCIKIIGLDSRLLFMSAAGQRTLGLNDFSTIANSVWLDYWPGRGRQDAEAAVRAAAEGGVGRFVGCSPTLRGEMRWWDSIVTPILGVSGRPERLLAVSRDITEQRRTQEQLQHAREMETLGTLASGVAQQFNDLLTPVMGYANILAKSLPPGPQLTAAASIARCAERAASLTAQMLEYAGRDASHLEPLSLSLLVQENREFFACQVPAGISLEFDLDPALPAVESDARQVRQVVLNLILNAVEAIDGAPGRIQVSTRRARFTPAAGGDAALDPPLSGECACLEVTDTGCGMDAETLARMFDPFFTTKLPGRGLGLAAAQGILRKHRGALRASSAPGDGATMRIWLPLHQPAPAEEQPSAPAAAAASGPATVLVIDPEQSVRHTARHILSLFGYSVLAAPDLPGSLQILDAHPEAGTVLLDVAAPFHHAAGVFQEIRRTHPGITILLAGASRDEDEIAAMPDFAGAAGFVPKPYDAVSLARAFTITHANFA
jgi:two-component system, cell cycle sensor histidine kinase and response regulator CckA